MIYNIKQNPLGIDISTEINVLNSLLSDKSIKPLIIILSGSYLYGTNDANSDIDIRGIFLNSNDRILKNDYKGTLKGSADGVTEEKSKKEKRNSKEKDKNDILLTELRDFLVQLYKNSPSALEILFAREECILYIDEDFKREFHDVRDKYLSQLIISSYGNYNISQIKKANNKREKNNYKKRDITRLPITSFVNINLLQNGYYKRQNLTEYLAERGMYDDLVALTGSNIYTAYYDWYKHYERKTGLKKYFKYFFKKGLSFKGIARDNSNDVLKTIVPRLSNKYCLGLCIFNQLEYSKHCDEYNSYVNWKENANHARFKNINDDSNDVVDGKNMQHSVRCADMFVEMMETGTIKLLRPNIDYLLSIKYGKVSLQEIFDYANKKFEDSFIEDLIKNTPLPKLPTGDIYEEELNFRSKYGNI